MSKLNGMHKAIMELVRQTMAEPDGPQMVMTATACRELSQAYQIMRETELHEEFHMGEEDGFKLPGEGIN